MYIVEFGAQISRDAGEDAIASKIELAGKVIIMVLAIPIMLALLELIIKLSPKVNKMKNKILRLLIIMVLLIFSFNTCSQKMIDIFRNRQIIKGTIKF